MSKTGKTLPLDRGFYSIKNVAICIALTISLLTPPICFLLKIKLIQPSIYRKERTISNKLAIHPDGELLG
ncbi:MAG: hypothetical protein U9N86_13980, partial [Bacteroidota bacterium]|nr:hypothetical protein [Bacteroidota bacterium]